MFYLVNLTSFVLKVEDYFENEGKQQRTSNFITSSIIKDVPQTRSYLLTVWPFKLVTLVRKPSLPKCQEQHETSL